MWLYGTIKKKVVWLYGTNKADKQDATFHIKYRKKSHKIKHGFVNIILTRFRLVNELNSSTAATEKQHIHYTAIAS